MMLCEADVIEVAGYADQQLDVGMALAKLLGEVSTSREADQAYALPPAMAFRAASICASTSGP